MERFSFFLFFFLFHVMIKKKKEIHKQLCPILRLGAELDPIRTSNLTRICIEADVMTKNFILPSRSTPTGTAALFSFTAFVKLNQTELLRFFFSFFLFPPLSPSLLFFLVPAFVLWLQVSYIIHEDWEAYPVLVILAFIPKEGAIFKRRIGHRWRQGSS